MSEQLEEQETSAADRAVPESASRLLDAMTGAVPSNFIRRHILEEILYYVLAAPAGNS